MIRTKLLTFLNIYVFTLQIFHLIILSFNIDYQIVKNGLPDRMIYDHNSEKLELQNQLYPIYLAFHFSKGNEKNLKPSVQTVIKLTIKSNVIYMYRYHLRQYLQ